MKRSKIVFRSLLKYNRNTVTLTTGVTGDIGVCTQCTPGITNFSEVTDKEVTNTFTRHSGSRG